MKTFTIDEYQRFRVPFGIGWKRELVLRCTGSTADKKAGDVYYHAPNGACKLRSNVEMNQYRKLNSVIFNINSVTNFYILVKRHPQITNLTIDNFTFAKQPIYRPPDEIVRHAMQRGTNSVDRPFVFYPQLRSKNMPNSRTDEISPLSSSIDRSSLNNSLIVNEDSNGPDANSDGILGRGKRKRVMPSRYDDNEIDLIPMNKRNKFNNQQRESHSNSNSNDAFSPHSKTSGRYRFDGL